MDETVAKWQAVALPESADEYDEWRTMALAALRAVVPRAREWGGALLYYESAYKGEAAVRVIRDQLMAMFDVNGDTLNRWRRQFQEDHYLPAATPRAEAQQERRLNAIPPAAEQGKRESDRVKLVEPETVTPDEVIAPAAARHPSTGNSAAATTKTKIRPPEQLAFTFETSSQRLVTVMAEIPADRHDELAVAIEAWLAKRSRTGAVTKRPSEVTPLFKGKGK